MTEVKDMSRHVTQGASVDIPDYHAVYSKGWRCPWGETLEISGAYCLNLIVGKASRRRHTRCVLRSRGLGDVYKRQTLHCQAVSLVTAHENDEGGHTVAVLLAYVFRSQMLTWRQAKVHLQRLLLKDCIEFQAAYFKRDINQMIISREKKWPR